MVTRSARPSGPVERLMRGMVVALCASLAGILIAACQPQTQKAASVIEDSLREKYSRDFKVQSIGGGYGTYDNTTWKATVVPVADPTLSFKATVKKDLSIVEDQYVGQLVVRETQYQLQAALAQTMGAGAFARVWLDEDSSSSSGPAPVVGEPGVSPRDFFAANPEYRPVAFIGIEGVPESGETTRQASSAAMALQGVTGRGKAFVYFGSPEQFRDLASKQEGMDLDALWMHSLATPDQAVAVEADATGTTVLSDLK